MPKKCCIPGCKTNYLKSNSARDPSKKVPVFRFPKDAENIQKWKNSLPFQEIKVNENTVICELHWPSLYQKELVRGKFRPRNPPSVWPDRSSPCTSSTSAPLPRPTTRALNSVRNQVPDEIEEFLKIDIQSAFKILQIVSSIKISTSPLQQQVSWTNPAL